MADKTMTGVLIVLKDLSNRFVDEKVTLDLFLKLSEMELLSLGLLYSGCGAEGRGIGEKSVPLCCFSQIAFLLFIMIT